MKLRLPNDAEINLNTNLSYEGKLEVVNNILKEFNSHFIKYWDTNKVRVCLDIMGSYLCHMPRVHDKEILSTKRFGQMMYGDKKCSPFSCLPENQQILLGLIDFVDEDEELN